MRCSLVVKLNIILNTIKTFLASRTSLSDIHFVYGFPGVTKAAPLTRPSVAVGVTKMQESKVDPVYSATDSTQLLYNRVADVRVRFDIYVPQTEDGFDCYEIFSRLGDQLLDAEASFTFVTAGCGDLKYKRDEGAFLLTAWIDIEQKTVS